MTCKQVSFQLGGSQVARLTCKNLPTNGRLGSVEEASCCRPRLSGCCSAHTGIARHKTVRRILRRPAAASASMQNAQTRQPGWSTGPGRRLEGAICMQHRDVQGQSRLRMGLLLRDDLGVACMRRVEERTSLRPWRHCDARTLHIIQGSARQTGIALLGPTRPNSRFLVNRIAQSHLLLRPRYRHLSGRNSVGHRPESIPGQPV